VSAQTRVSLYCPFLAKKFKFWFLSAVIEFCTAELWD